MPTRDDDFDGIGMVSARITSLGQLQNQPQFDSFKYYKKVKLKCVCDNFASFSYFNSSVTDITLMNMVE